MNNKADVLKFNALKKALEEDKLRIYLNYEKINRPGSPVYNPWETLLPILLPILIGILLILTVGPLFGLFFIILMILVYTYYFKKKLYMRLILRTKEKLADNIESMENLWNYGGFVIVNAENKKIGCVAPLGDWKDFIVLNFSDLMTEKKEDKKEDVKKDVRKPRK